MKKVQLEIIGLSYSQTQSGAYALVLSEFEGTRRLPIIIGGFEAQAIAIELENMVPSRPLTHDLFRSFANAFNIIIKEVIIYNLKEGIFFSKLICRQGEKEIEIDSRTSDAIALAVRFKCNIYTYESIIGSAGIRIEEDEINSPSNLSTSISEPSKSNPFSKTSLKELNKKLAKAVQEEDYELASKIRDEINRRSS